MQNLGMKEVAAIMLEIKATGDPIVRPRTFENFLKSLILVKEMKGQNFLRRNRGTTSNHSEFGIDKTRKDTSALRHYDAPMRVG